MCFFFVFLRSESATTLRQDWTNTCVLEPCKNDASECEERKSPNPGKRSAKRSVRVYAANCDCVTCLSKHSPNLWWIPSWEPNWQSNCLKALLKENSLSEYGSEGFQVQLRRLSEYGSVACNIWKTNTQEWKNKPKRKFSGQISRGRPGGHSCWRPGSKASSRPSKLWKDKHLGADIHDPNARTSMTPGGCQKNFVQKTWG